MPFFNGVKEWDEIPGALPPPAYLERVIQRYTTPNGVLGFVVMWMYLPQITNMLKQIPRYSHLDKTQLLTAAFDRPEYIWMRRRDRVQQAVSWVIAIQTDVWMRRKDRSPSSRVAPQFDFAMIDHFYRKIINHDAAWQHYFRQNRIKPLTLFYEEVVRSNRDAVERVLNFLDIPLSMELEVGPPRIEKQATAISNEWAAQYRKLKRDRTSSFARALQWFRRGFRNPVLSRGSNKLFVMLVSSAWVSWFGDSGITLSIFLVGD